MDEKQGPDAVNDGAPKKPARKPAGTMRPTPDSEKQKQAAPEKYGEIKHADTTAAPLGGNADKKTGADKDEAAAPGGRGPQKAFQESDIFDEVSSQIDLLISDEKKAAPVEKVPEEAGGLPGQKPSPAGKPAPKAASKPIAGESKVTGQQRQPDLQSKKSADAIPPAKPPEKKKEPPAKKPTPEKKEAEKPRPPEKSKLGQKKFVVKHEPEPPKAKETPAEISQRPPALPRKKAPEKITVDIRARAAPPEKKAAGFSGKEVFQKPKTVEETKKSVTQPAPPAKGTKMPGKAVKRQGRAVEPRTQKIDQKKVKGRSSARAYILLGGLLLTAGIWAVVTFDPLGLFQGEEAPPQITAQKVQPIPVKPKEKKVALRPVPVKPEETKIVQRPVPVKKEKAALAPGPAAPERTALIQPPGPKKTAPGKARQSVSATDEIKQFLNKWKTALENSAGKNGDMEAYISFYSNSFSAQGFDRNGWKKDETFKNRGKEWSRLVLKDIKIVGPLAQNRYEVSFIQDYRSSDYSGISSNTLVLKKESAGWKIVGIQTAPRPSAARTSYPYSLYHGSYQGQAAAAQYVASYREMGLDAYWVRVDLGQKGIWYRVFIGWYKDSETAQKVIRAKQLKYVKPVETRYAGLIGTYLSDGRLKSESRLLSEKGYAPYHIEDDEGRYHLFVGAFYTMKNAEKLTAELNAKGIRAQAVKR